MFLSSLQKKVYKNFFLIIAFLFTGSISISAQDPDPKDTNRVISAPVDVPPAALPGPEVIAVTSCDPAHPNISGVGDDIMVKIKNAETFFDEAKKDEARVVLFVNNKAVRDVVYEHTADGIRFFMHNEGDVTTLWNYLMESRGSDEFFEKKVSISVGIEGKDSVLTTLDPIPTKIDGKEGRSYTLILVHKGWFAACILFMLAIIIIFLTIGSRSDMLRDTGPHPATGRKPYSLARVQMAIWFVVIISSWLLLYVCLHHFNLLNEKILILMGITAGTGVGGLALDANKDKTITSPSEGFFKDLISDHSNISLFRFQNLAWTVILVVVFVRYVIVYMKMPEFDTTLLLLMGISSGTYIGAKVTEKRGEEEENKGTPEPADQP
ncbi:MAG: hypothetical protein M3R17_07065 [Bacteroidota bacterium]|nr:hypothetical protein [Bacteroidota bacterium]